jgi:hypothetical protein
VEDAGVGVEVDQGALYCRGLKTRTPLKTIRLRQPEYMQVHIEDIARVESPVGDDKKEGTWIYLHGESEPRYCLETAEKVREIIEEARSKGRNRPSAFA